MTSGSDGRNCDRRSKNIVAHRLSNGARFQAETPDGAADVSGTSPLTSSTSPLSIMSEYRTSTKECWRLNAAPRRSGAPELHASPHVEHCAGFIRHPARIPRRIPHDVDLDLADARHAGDRALHHDRQLSGP